MTFLTLSGLSRPSIDALRKAYSITSAAVIASRSWWKLAEAVAASTTYSANLVVAFPYIFGSLTP